MFKIASAFHFRTLGGGLLMAASVVALTARAETGSGLR